jgi:glutathione synthase/RimK-type ligase-like ATP-grasp enzyme
LSPRAGIFGAADDLQVQAVARALRALGAKVLHFDPLALELERPVSELDGVLRWDSQPVGELAGCYVCTLPSQFAELEAGQPLDAEARFVEAMRQRERAAFVFAWLLELEARGTRLVNALHAGSALQFKAFQLNVLRRLGAAVPPTLISNEPAAVRAFAGHHPEVIFKPLTGGAQTRLLDAGALARLEDLAAAPCIFQQRIEGEDVRVTLVDGEVCSAVVIRTPAQALDYRADPVYAAGLASYEDVALPAQVVEQCRAASAACGLVLAGVDLKRRPDGGFVFLELNSSPIYADVERKRGHGISEAIARAVLRRG